MCAPGPYFAGGGEELLLLDLDEFPQVDEATMIQKCLQQQRDEQQQAFMTVCAIRLVLARWPSRTKSACKLALPVIKVTIRDMRAIVDTIQACAADRSVQH